MSLQILPCDLFNAFVVNDNDQSLEGSLKVNGQVVTLYWIQL